MLSIVFVVNGGGFLRILLRFLFNTGTRGCNVDERIDRRERLYFRKFARRFEVLSEAEVSGDGGSPKIKNLMKATIRITIESCPSNSP